MEFFMNFHEGNIALWSYLPWWLMILILVGILTLIIWLVRRITIKRHAKRFRRTFFSRFISGDSDWSYREVQATKDLGTGYMAVELMADPNKGSNSRKAPLVLWKVTDTRSARQLFATPVEGYSPTAGDAVRLIRWICERYDKRFPAVMYFIEPA